MNKDIKKDFEHLQSLTNNIKDVQNDMNILQEQNNYAMKGLAKSIEDNFSDEKLSQIKFKDLELPKPGFFKRLFNKIFL